MHYAPCDTFDDGSLSYTGITDEDRIVLFAAGENVQDTADLFVAADDRIQLSVKCPLIEVDTIFLKGVVLVFGALVTDLPSSAQFFDRSLQSFEGGALVLKDLGSLAATFHDPEQHDLCGDKLISKFGEKLFGFSEGFVARI